MKKAKHQSGLLERLGLKKQQQSLIPLGVGWYTAENWAHAKETAADPEKFEATFEEWSNLAEDALRKMAAPNISVKSFASLTGTAQKRAALYLNRYAA